MDSFITSIPVMIAVITIVVAASLYLSGLKGFRALGPALICILLGVLLSNTGVTPFEHSVYDFTAEYLISLSIVIMLLSTDLKSIRTLSSQPLIAVTFAFVSVVITAFMFGVFFAPIIDEGWKLSGMFVGTYTGGSPNLNAIGAALNVSPEMMAAANTADYIVYTPFIIAMMYLGGSLKNMKWFAKIWPYKLEDDHLSNDDGGVFMEAGEWSITDIAWIIAIGFSIVGASEYLAGFTPPSLAGTFGTLILTTVSLIAAQLEPIKRLRGKVELGMYFSLCYLSLIGLTVDLKEFFKSAPIIGIYCFFIVFGSAALHCFFCRICKIKYQIVMVSMQAAIGSDASAPMLAASSGWKSLVGVGVVMGVIGNAAGNYLGLALAYILKMILGL